VPPNFWSYATAVAGEESTLEAEVGRRAPSVNSMRILGARSLPESLVTAEALKVSWSVHSRTGRIAEADRKTHFQSSTSGVVLEGMRRN
jgi:hypothetical protein